MRRRKSAQSGGEGKRTAICTRPRRGPGRLGERSKILICVKQVALRRQRKRVYRAVAALALPSRAQLRADPNAAVPMRDFVADWKKWSPAERVLAVMVTLSMVALPLGLLMTG
jgi:hypothetical protein